MLPTLHCAHPHRAARERLSVLSAPDSYSPRRHGMRSHASVIVASFLLVLCSVPLGANRAQAITYAYTAQPEVCLAAVDRR
jgi:hypothetical protein